MERRLLRPARQSTTGLLHVLAQLLLEQHLRSLSQGVEQSTSLRSTTWGGCSRCLPIWRCPPVPSAVPSTWGRLSTRVHPIICSLPSFAGPSLHRCLLQGHGAHLLPLLPQGCSTVATLIIRASTARASCYSPRSTSHLGDALCLYGVAELSAALELGPYAERVNIGALSRLSRSAILVYEPALGAGICIHPSRRSSVSLSGRVFTPPALRLSWWEQTFGIFLATVGERGIQGGLTVLLPQPSPRQR
jgi:hypothetical protein